MLLHRIDSLTEDGAAAAYAVFPHWDFDRPSVGRWSSAWRPTSCRASIVPASRRAVASPRHLPSLCGLFDFSRAVNAVAFIVDDLRLFDEAHCRRVDDEHYLSAEYGSVVGKHSVAVGNALMAHWSYYPQRSGLGANLLARYEALSNGK
jgi:hypothetical protein